MAMDHDSAYTIPSDEHPIVWSIYSSSAENEYLTGCDLAMHRLVERVSSLNEIGDKLWLDGSQFPAPIKEWLDVLWDSALVRLRSIPDCVLILIARIFDLRDGNGKPLSPRECTAKKIMKGSNVPTEVKEKFDVLLNANEKLREETNRRIHHADERAQTQDDAVFWMVSVLSDSASESEAKAKFNYAAPLLRNEFVAACRKTESGLNALYDDLQVEFEARAKQK